MSPLGSYQTKNFLDPVSIKYPTTKKVSYIAENDDELKQEISNVKAKLDFKRESQAKSPNPAVNAPSIQAVSPQMGKDKARKVNAIDDLFKTSGIFSKSSKWSRKKSKYWGANELMALMGSVSKKRKDEENSPSKEE